MKRVDTRLVASVFVAALLVTACSTGEGEAVGTTTIAESTAAVAEMTTTTDSPGAVSDLTDVRSAVVRIVTEGSFVDPEMGMVFNAAGSGSGFIIDPSGIAVTNNHVVTGAAFLQVYIDGEDDPRNAKILGVSECSDLAVIDIDGAGFPFLEWYYGDITTGTKVFAAGFALGDPEYTLTNGIVSKERADGETSWASVDFVIEHTAQILPGSSGGPLVTEDGRVLAVNHASVIDLDLYFAISRDEVAEILDDLIAGHNIHSIGVNGTAVVVDGLSGIWVAATESGSPANNLGITGGDIITMMEGVALAVDGTMANYCDILRSHDADDPLTVEVLRFDTGEVLEGMLNRDEALTLAFSFTDEPGDGIAFSFADELGDGAAGVSTIVYDYMEVRDDYDTIVMLVPTTWTEVDGSAWDVEGLVVGNQITASTSLFGYEHGWVTPGAFFGVSDVMIAGLTNPGDLLDVLDFADVCIHDGRFPFEQLPFYTGVYDVWLNCGGTDTSLIILEAYPPEADFVVVIKVQVVTDADLEALDMILHTFDVVSR